MTAAKPNPDVIQATFLTARPVPSRGVVTFTFDVPTKHASAALELLGGFPDGGESVWVAIARLTEAAAQKASPKERYDAADEGAKAVVRAGMLVDDPAFQKWIGVVGARVDAAEKAAQLLRAECGIKSRAELATNPEALKWFLALEARFKYPDFVR